MSTVANLMPGCTTTGATKCTTATSCCAGVSKTASGTAGSTLVCIPTGSTVTGKLVAGAAITNPAIVSGGDMYAAAACSGTSGASSLAVSAAAAATALYVLY